MLGHYGLYWSNQDGWGDYANGERFTETELKATRLPQGGFWTGELATPLLDDMLAESANLSSTMHRERSNHADHSK